MACEQCPHCEERRTLAAISGNHFQRDPEQVAAGHVLTLFEVIAVLERMGHPKRVAIDRVEYTRLWLLVAPHQLAYNMRGILTLGGTEFIPV